MKPIAVLDSSIVVAGIGWRRDARLVLRLLARRGFIFIRTPYLTTEWTQTVSRLSTDPRRVSSRMVAADVRRQILARKPLPPRYLGGYGSCDDS